LLKITIAHLADDSSSQSAEDKDWQSMWQALVAEANEVVSVLQSWKPEYFEAIDPMCSYIIFLAGCVLVLNDKAGGTPSRPRTSEHVDLALLFLDRVGQHWPIGA
jgi:hypothetical protein